MIEAYRFGFDNSGPICKRQEILSLVTFAGSGQHSIHPIFALNSRNINVRNFLTIPFSQLLAPLQAPHKYACLLVPAVSPT